MDFDLEAGERILGVKCKIVPVGRQIDGSGAKKQIDPVFVIGRME